VIIKRYVLKKILVFGLLTILLYPFVLHAGKITIAVAANVSYAIEDLKKTFNLTNTETTVQVILGSSGKLTAQIMNGAPFDLLLSANMLYPNRLYEENMATMKPKVYAQGALAILSNKKRDYRAKIFVLEDADIDKIAIGNPKTAPYGVAAKEALTNATIYDKVKHKLVYGESVSQTLGYVMTAADIGIVAKSSLYASQMSTYKEAIHWLDVDEKLYTPIDQGMVILKSAKGNAEVKAFYDFMLSSKAKAILKQYGYKVP